MDFQKLIQSITPEIYKSLKTAVEIGKWPNGQLLSKDQREISLQAIISYEMNHLSPEERSGYIAPKKHTACATATDTQVETPIKWKQ